jgi:hypothetical protein
LLKKIHPRSNLTALLVTFLGSDLSIFEEKFQIGCHLKNFSRRFFQKIELKSHFKKEIFSKSVFLNIFIFCHISCKYKNFQNLKNWEVLSTGFQNGDDFQNG